MDKHDMMPVRANQATLWTLSDDRKTVQMRTSHRHISRGTPAV
jgi:hypothetical protein